MEESTAKVFSRTCLKQEIDEGREEGGTMGCSIMFTQR